MVLSNKFIKKFSKNPELMNKKMVKEAKESIKNSRKVSYKTIRHIKKDPEFKKIKKAFEGHRLNLSQECRADALVAFLLEKYNAFTNCSLGNSKNGIVVIVDNKKLL